MPNLPLRAAQQSTLTAPAKWIRARQGGARGQHSSARVHPTHFHSTRGLPHPSRPFTPAKSNLSVPALCNTKHCHAPWHDARALSQKHSRLPVESPLAATHPAENPLKPCLRTCALSHINAVLLCIACLPCMHSNVHLHFARMCIELNMHLKCGLMCIFLTISTIHVYCTYGKRVPASSGWSLWPFLVSLCLQFNPFCLTWGVFRGVPRGKS